MKKIILPNKSSQILLGNKKKFKTGSILEKKIEKIRLKKKTKTRIDNVNFFKHL